MFKLTIGSRTRLTFPDTGANALYVSYVYDVLNRVTSIGENGATRAWACWRAMAMTGPDGCRA